jgi:hypothetical protein
VAQEPVKPKRVVKPVALVPVDEAGQQLNADLVKGNTITVAGRPAVVQGHTRRGGLVVTPGTGTIKESSANRPRVQGDRDLSDDPDYGAAGEDEG